MSGSGGSRPACARRKHSGVISQNPLFGALRARLRQQGVRDFLFLSPAFSRGYPVTRLRRLQSIFDLKLKGNCKAATLCVAFPSPREAVPHNLVSDSLMEWQKNQPARCLRLTDVKSA